MRKTESPTTYTGMKLETRWAHHGLMDDTGGARPVSSFIPVHVVGEQEFSLRSPIENP